MIPALAWKEYREHRAIWLSLAIVGGAGLFGLTRLMALEGVMSGSGTREPLLSVAILLAWMYGLVCGSMLLANERETGTMTFLDMLPMCRLHLWLVKCAIGLIFLLGQVVVLIGFLLWLNRAENRSQLTWIFTAMLFFGLVGMSWGLLFSARGESVLNVIGLAIAGQIAALFAFALLMVPVLIVLKSIGWEEQGPFLILVLQGLAAVVLTAGPLIGSARIFSHTDRLRRQEAKEVRGRPHSSIGESWSRLLWLNYAQMRRLLVGLMLFSLALGFLLPVVGPAAWPILTLFLGVLCGVTVCADEQAHGSFRFLGDQRFPLGRVWIVKLGMRFTLAVFAAFLLMLPSLIRTLFHRLESSPIMERQNPFFGEVLHSSLVGSIVPTGLHLTMWLLYGFSMGQLSGVLFRKSLVAAVVSLGGAATLLSLWLPSLLGIGLHFWQIASVPLVLLLTAWALVPAWAADRLIARGTFVRLGAAFALAGLCIAGGLWYRVAEVPDVPDSLDMPAFVAGIPSLEENKAGLVIRSACIKVDALERTLRQRRPNVPNQQADPLAQASEVLQRGWSEERPELAAWLDAMLQDNWTADLAEIPDQPLGILEDPRRLTLGSLMDKAQAARLLTVVLAARGLQRQAAGHDDVFADNLRIGLTVSRTLQHDSPFIMALIGRATEAVWLSTLEHWLEKLRGRPQLLEHVLQTLLRHEAEMPAERETLQAEYLMARNTLEDTPEQLIKSDLDNRRTENDRLRRAEIQGTVLAWLFPLEQERHRRILRVMFQGDLRQRRQARAWGGILSDFNLPSDRLSRPKRGLAQLHASQLQVALRLYQAETGKPAATLDALVPRYLPAIPSDPFDGQPLRYRLSKGERIGWPKPEPANPPVEVPNEPAPFQPPPAGRLPGMGGALPAVPAPPPTRWVPKGQGILWSVGEDGRDDGGVQQSTQNRAAPLGEDIIYLVPLPAK